jgi:hypothetical protein
MLELIRTFKADKDWQIVFSEKLLSEPDIHGEINHKTKMIVINPQKDSLHEALATFIHECLHRTFSKYTEKRIRQLEEAIAKDLAPAEKAMIAMVLFSIASWEE